MKYGTLSLGISICKDTFEILIKYGGTEDLIPMIIYRSLCFWQDIILYAL